MNTKERISALESRQLELLDIMAKSDAHAAKCTKLGKKFSTQYPDDYAAYTAANEEYQTVEQRISELEFEISVENEDPNAAEQSTTEPSNEEE